MVEQDPSLPPRSGRELSAAGGARESSAAPGQRSRLWLRLQPCPAPGFGCALWGCLLPVPPPVTCPPQLHCRALSCPLLGRGGVASSRSLWQLSHPPALVLAGFPCKCSAVNPCVIPSPPAPPGRAGGSLSRGGQGWGGGLGSVSDNPVGCRTRFPIPTSPSQFHQLPPTSRPRRWLQKSHFFSSLPERWRSCRRLGVPALSPLRVALCTLCPSQCGDGAQGSGGRSRARTEGVSPAPEGLPQDATPRRGVRGSLAAAHPQPR